MKDADFRESSLLASQVFAHRLRETREARGLTQIELARQTVATGNPISQPALSRIETGERPVSLDEALALTEILRAVPAHMLTPPEGRLVRLSEGLATDGSTMRQWLVSGLPFRSDQEPPSELVDAVERDRYLVRLHRLATALVDAARIRGDDGKDAQRNAALALSEEVLRERARLAGRQ